MGIKTLDEYMISFAENRLHEINTYEGIFDFYYKNLREGLERSNNPYKYYKKYIMYKRDGSEREIFIPDKIMRAHHTFIKNNILNSFPVNENVFAYVPGRSGKEAAMRHYEYMKNCPESIMIHIDIKDFFGTITAKKIYDIFEREFEFSKELKTFLTNICSLVGTLPTGASTSPMISNICFYHVDDMISDFAAEHEILYTRYSDDLFFSFNECKVSSEKLISNVSQILKNEGFSINSKKTRINRRGHKFSVLGINTNDKFQVGKNYRRRIRQEVYYVKKYGIESHLKRIKPLNSNQYNEQLRFLDDFGESKTQEKYLKSLYGKITYCLYINPDDEEMKVYKKELEIWLNKYSKTKCEEKESFAAKLEEMIDRSFDEIWAASEADYKENYYLYYFDSLYDYLYMSGIYENAGRLGKVIKFSVNVSSGCYHVEIKVADERGHKLEIKVLNPAGKEQSVYYNLIYQWYSILETLSIEKQLTNMIPEMKELYTDKHIKAMDIAVGVGKLAGKGVI